MLYIDNINALPKADAKKAVSELRRELLAVISRAMKTRYLNPIEQRIIDDILLHEMHDHGGTYPRKYCHVLQNYWIVCGILYNHADDLPPGAETPVIIQQHNLPYQAASFPEYDDRI